MQSPGGMILSHITRKHAGGKTRPSSAILSTPYTADPRVTTGLTYEQRGLRPKILVLTCDQSLELRPACRSRPLELRPAWHS
jgi:hypothetical protein